MLVIFLPLGVPKSSSLINRTVVEMSCYCFESLTALLVEFGSKLWSILSQCAYQVAGIPTIPGLPWTILHVEIILLICKIWCMNRSRHIKTLCIMFFALVGEVVHCVWRICDSKSLSLTFIRTLYRSKRDRELHMLLCQVWGFAGLSSYRHPAHVWALLNLYHNATQVFLKHFYQPNLGPRSKSSIWREAHVEGQSCFFRGAAVSLAVASISERFASSMLSFSRVCCIRMDCSQIKMPFSRHGIF